MEKEIHVCRKFEVVHEMLWQRVAEEKEDEEKDHDPKDAAKKNIIIRLYI